MKLKGILFGATLILVTATVTTTVVSQQDKGKGQPAAPPDMPPEVAALMATCMEAGTPGDNHELLSKRVGSWKCNGSFWMMPGMDPMKADFTAEMKSIYGGRYIVETVEAQMPEGTFLGESRTGYDNVTKKFFSSWISNDSTSEMASTGTYDPASKTFTYATTWSCPLAKKKVTGRTVEKWVDNDHIHVETFGPWHETGKEFKMMEFHYNRAK